MSDINWSQKRRVLRNTETGEIYVKVETGVMLVEDYIDGGKVQLQKHCEPLELVGVFTNAEIDKEYGR